MGAARSSLRIGALSAALAGMSFTAVLCASPASAAVTAQAEARTFGNSILVTLLDVQSTTDAPARCAILVRDADDQPVMGQLMEILDGGVGVYWATTPHETLHLAGQYTDSADYTVTAQCADDDGAVGLVDTVVTLPTGELVGNPPRYSELFGPF
ncbi:3-oxoacyl-ACP synthase [Prescottella defluvii]|uniref:3-oxoacyl-ACP synthase n=1 Tax=Prescottella defluvii TaxID=1323361 RepID=UPI000A705D62|nr:3-oxoacyl-ACP synthase [Prescottella defluvii]